MTFVLARRGAPELAGLWALLLVASSPYALLHATEIATECPYLAISMAAIVLITRRGAPGKRDVALLAVLLSFLPFLRTIGLALIAAVALWCFLDRSRRVWLPAPAVAAVVTLVWMLRNRMAGGPTYFGSVAAELSRSHLSGFLAKAASAVGYYASRLTDVLLPGVFPGRPLYERMTLGGAPDLGGAWGLGWLAVLAAVGLAVWGGWMRRREDGALIGLYALLFLAILAIYPPKHERLTWPLVPLVWALAPAGLSWIKARWVGVAAMSLAALVIVWQTSSSFAMVRDNLAFTRGGDAFYVGRVPPLYFADWQAAGAWLHAHAAKGDVLLTRHSDVGFTSGLLQESIRFEELPPAAWRKRIAALSARWLVVPTSLYGKFFPLELSGSDPAYVYETVWKGNDVAVLSVAPNRKGIVLPVPAPEPEAISACEAAAAREPGRTDLTVRCAELLAQSGKRAEAIARLRALAAREGADVRSVVALAQMLVQDGQAAEAAAAYRKARGLPESDLLERTIEGGLRLSDELAAAQGLDKGVRARTLTLRARDRMAGLRWQEAYALLNDALAFGPDDPVVLAAAGDWMVRTGQYAAALGYYRHAGTFGDEDARAKGEALRRALDAELAGEGALPADVMAAAEFWAGDGAPGRALSILEGAARTHPGDALLASRLADVRDFYGLR
jgi:tetratricopeptide (TPR) repeat protein